MSEDCSHHCSSCGEECSHRESGITKDKLNEASRVRKVIAVVSGKGGVGKSLVTSLLSVLMNRKGYRTAILDADITGPSIPKAFGLNDHAMMSEHGIFPVISSSGINILSVNSILENETDPVLWRGPIIAGTVRQFWTEVFWNNIDYMFVDMPPGTGDVPLTVFQSLPVDGIIIVTSPQELVSMIVTKAINMAKMMNIPVLGIVENMSCFECPHCGTKHFLFGESRLDEIARTNEVDALGQIPVEPTLSRLCDQGKIESFEGSWLDHIIEKLETI